jgi:hypothetical protein
MTSNNLPQHFKNNHHDEQPRVRLVDEDPEQPDYVARSTKFVSGHKGYNKGSVSSAKADSKV